MPKVLLLTAWGLVVVILLCLLPVPAAAGGVVGSGLGTCTEAALDAALAGGGAITFNCGNVPAQIALTSAKVITLNTSLDGADKITLSGSSATRIFVVSPTASLSLANLGLTGGSAGNDDGGAVLNLGRLSLNHVAVYGNHTNQQGGGIASSGALTLTNSAVYNNVAGARGGGIYSTGSLRLTGTDFSGNSSGVGGALYVMSPLKTTVSGGTFFSNTTSLYGGALYLLASTVQVDASTFLSNTSVSAGALYNYSGYLTVTRSLLQGNTASNTGGAIQNEGHLRLEAVTLIGNSAGLWGGALINGQFLAASSVILSSTLAGNQAQDGGGLLSGFSVTLINSTLSGNTAARYGGAIDAVSGATQLYNSTVAGNQASAPITATDPALGGGLYVTGTASLVAENALIALNTSGPAPGPQTPDDCYGPLQSLGHNLIKTVANCALSGSTTGNLTGQDPHLGPLADNGGPARTRALLPGSPAINAGLSADCPPVDQRGQRRLGACDIGAFEFALHLFLPLLRK